MVGTIIHYHSFEELYLEGAMIPTDNFQISNVCHCLIGTRWYYQDVPCYFSLWFTAPLVMECTYLHWNKVVQSSLQLY